ncbi:hypothetical protein Aperf_G00000016814 [Anoplocephala perfoliata]
MSTDLGKNVLGYEFTNIFNTADDASFSIPWIRLRRGIGDAAYILRLRSPLLSEFFERFSLPLTKQSFRRVMLFYSLLLAVTIMGVISNIPFGGYRLSGVPLYGGFFLTGVLTLLTIFDLTNRTYTWISIGFMSIVGLCIIIHFGSISITLPMQYTILSLFSFIVYTHLPVPLSFSIALHLLLFFGLIMMDSFKVLQRSAVLETVKRRQQWRIISEFGFYLTTATTFLAVYLKTFQTLRFKASFLRVSQAVHLNTQRKKTMAQQSKWINAVMPKEIRLTYCKMLKENGDMSNLNWVFCETYDPVTILFSEISGFTKLLEDMSASTILFLLNSLFSKFDYLCYNCGCERIGTLGSIYYCISGCPIPREDHVKCCANLALLMVDFVKGFKQEFLVELTLKVAIHTGSVSGAIVGMDRFRFDIYSYSVQIAQKLLGTCASGQIHISSDVKQLLPESFKTFAGSGITEKRDVSSIKKVDVQVPTFYLDLESERLLSVSNFSHKNDPKDVFRLDENKLIDEGSEAKNRHTSNFKKSGSLRNRMRNSKKSEYRNIRNEPYSRIERPPTSAIWNRNSPHRRKSIGIQEYLFGTPAEDQEALSQYIETKETNLIDNEVIDELHSDSRNLAFLINYQLLNQFTLHFKDSTLEGKFKERRRDWRRPVYIDSLKLAPAFDMVMLFLYILMFNAAYTVAASTEWIQGVLLSIGAFAAAIFIAFPCANLIIYAVFIKPSKTTKSFIRGLIYLGQMRVFIELSSLVICLIPTMEMLCYLWLSHRSEVFRPKDEFFMFFGPAAILVHCLPMDSRYMFRAAAAGLSTGIFIASIMVFSESETPSRYEYAWFFDDSAFQPRKIACFITMVLSWLTVVFIARMNESTSRMRSYMMLQAEEAAEISVRAIKECNKFIYNVIPRHVVRMLLAEGTRTLNTNTVNQATLVPQVGIAFIRIANFFEEYYRENYQTGKKVIELLNQIICEFDRRLQKVEFQSVEKLRTYNDSYMIAAGLDLQQRETTSDPTKHLIKLLKFCYGLFKIIKNFNNRLDLERDKQLHLAIGMDLGVVCAGLIGSEHPYYHLVGQPADIAYALHLISAPGKIVVTENMRSALIPQFQFEPAKLQNPPKTGMTYYYWI